MRRWPRRQLQFSRPSGARACLPFDVWPACSCLSPGHHAPRGTQQNLRNFEAVSFRLGPLAMVNAEFVLDDTKIGNARLATLFPEPMLIQDGDTAPDTSSKIDGL